ncbi:MAG: hypothetical protein DGJ47_000025 [Rickettsiaceae bacterium]
MINYHTNKSLSRLINHMKKEWFSNVKGDVLSGLVVALALIPEAIAFSIVAGVDPQVGLYSSFCIAVITAIIGGRSGMISAATGAMAVLMVTLVKDHGLQYLLAATVLTGVIEILAGVFKLGSLLRFVSKSVITGFLNALAILIFLAQLPEFNGANWQMYTMVAAGLSIIYLFPYVNNSIPSPLIAIVSLTVFSVVTGMDLRTVGDMGDLPNTLPMFLAPNIPLNLETLWIILPYSTTLAAVGLLESMMTAVIIDDFTDTSSDKNQECVGQGVANVITGFFGGMAGCALIGQSVINIKSGGRGRLSSFLAGAFLLFLILVLSDFVKAIPMAALVAVMFMVAIGTFDWSSITNIRRNSKYSTMVTFTTVTIVILTHDLAKGVFAGVLMSSLFFAKKVAKLLSFESEIESDDNSRTYKIHGQVFFVSASAFSDIFNFQEPAEKITIDLTNAHFWDVSAVESLEKVVARFNRMETKVCVVGLNEASKTVISQSNFLKNI